MLVNPDSESVGLFSSEEKNELIYHLFKILCVGGAMSQPDTTITRYDPQILPDHLISPLDILSSQNCSTRSSSFSTSMELLDLIPPLPHVLRASSNNGEIKSACQVFQITSITGLTLFPSTANPAHSHLIVVINRLEKYLVTLQLNYTSFWS
jgi:hypothetical protein